MLKDVCVIVDHLTCWCFLSLFGYIVSVAEMFGILGCFGFLLFVEEVFKLCLLFLCVSFDVGNMFFLFGFMFFRCGTGRRRR